MTETKGLFDKAIYKKLLIVQSEAGKIKKEKVNPFFKSSYFDINAMLDALRPTLLAQNLLLVQPSYVKEGKNIQASILVDVDSGEEVRSELVMPEEDNPQTIGGMVTYFRRYTLQNLLSLEAEDDDGNTASKKPPAGKKPPAKKKPEPINDEQKDLIADLLKNVDPGLVAPETTESIRGEMSGFTKVRADECIKFLEQNQSE